MVNEKVFIPVIPVKDSKSANVVSEEGSFDSFNTSKSPSFSSPPHNHIKEYIDSQGSEEKFLELFDAKDDNVDLRTDITIQEIVVLNKFRTFVVFLESKGLDLLYKKFLYSYLRLKVSNERKSRTEFVDIHRKERFEQNLKRYGDFKNLFDSKS